MNSEAGVAWPSFREQARSILNEAWLASGETTPMPEFEDDDDLLETGAADSFLLLELICGLERTYEVDVPYLEVDSSTISSVSGLYSIFGGTTPPA